MGRDKGGLAYHGKPQREHQADLLNNVCDTTFISCRKSQTKDIKSQYQFVIDKYSDLGPFGGMLSAFNYDPNAAWLIVACDFPYLNQTTINQLIEARDPSKVATCFHNPNNNFPEPLITIWEPKAKTIFENFLAQGYFSPKSILINTNIKEVQLEDKICLTKVNKKEQYEVISNSFAK